MSGYLGPCNRARGGGTQSTTARRENSCGFTRNRNSRDFLFFYAQNQIAVISHANTNSRDSTQIGIAVISRETEIAVIFLRAKSNSRDFTQTQIAVISRKHE